jgi:hypothetical protein
LLRKLLIKNKRAANCKQWNKTSSFYKTELEQIKQYFVSPFHISTQTTKSNKNVISVQDFLHRNFSSWRFFLYLTIMSRFDYHVPSYVFISISSSFFPSLAFISEEMFIKEFSVCCTEVAMWQQQIRVATLQDIRW